MTGFNRVVLVGNLTRDPELRFTPNGIPVCDFGLAVNRVRSKDDAPDYFQVVAWRELGEIIANYKKKGDGVLVEGRLRYDAWEAEDGSKRSKVTVVAEQVQFLSSPNGKRGGSSGSGATRAENGSGGSGRRGGSETTEEEWDDVPFAHLQRKSPVF
jgi:single-strand DNA-binding protein